jgi:putative transposase
MPRKPRLTHPGYYHVISRGVERRDVFLETEDFEQFMDILQNVRKNYHIALHAFCLMNNHYHLLLETHDENISEAMRVLNSHYAAWFNRKYSRSGHLWQGRYKSYILFDDEHFWNVVKYIERNPVAATIVECIDNYPYQSFYQRIYQTKYLTLIEGSRILELSLEEYASLVDTSLDDQTLNAIYKSPKLMQRDDGSLEILSKRLNTFFETDGQHSRNQKIINASQYGYSKTDIAQYLDMSVMAISKIVTSFQTVS